MLSRTEDAGRRFKRVASLPLVPNRGVALASQDPGADVLLRAET
jgi:hypothetical protein